MLLVTSTGVFLPLEVALNNVWGVKQNRNYLMNQVVSLGLAAAVGALVMGSVAATAAQRTLLTWIFFGHTDNIVFRLIGEGVLSFFAVIASILIFFLIYWILPHRKIPAMAVLPTAIVVGISWEVAKYLYVLALPRLDFESVYGPFRVSVGIMMWAFLSGSAAAGRSAFLCESVHAAAGTGGEAGGYAGITMPGLRLGRHGLDDDGGGRAAGGKHREQGGA